MSAPVDIPAVFTPQMHARSLVISACFIWPGLLPPKEVLNLQLIAEGLSFGRRSSFSMTL